MEVSHHVAHGKALPEVVEHIVAKMTRVRCLWMTDLLESGLLQERDDGYELTGPCSLAIPTTLHDSLMARLDRLATVKGLAQLGATLGREFSYELLRAVAWGRGIMRGLHQLVAAEFLYQAGAAAGDLPLQAR